MLLLDAVNLVMPKLGERPVTSLTVKHPTLGILLPIIEQTRRNALRRGWWFNEFQYEAFPGTDGTIDIGIDTLSFIPDMADTAVVRGTKLYNPLTLSYVFTHSVKGRVIKDVPFEELPESAAAYVFYSSLVDAFATDLGVSEEFGVWQSMAARAWSDLLAEHLRQRKFTTRRSRRWQQLRSALRS